MNNSVLPIILMIIMTSLIVWWYTLLDDTTDNTSYSVFSSCDSNVAKKKLLKRVHTLPSYEFQIIVKMCHSFFFNWIKSGERNLVIGHSTDRKIDNWQISRDYLFFSSGWLFYRGNALYHSDICNIDNMFKKKVIKCLKLHCSTSVKDAWESAD